ncbi:MAG: hypothetical protein K8I03_08505 [Ignavibacteria bacterium]|nr:hypothetical protein [Ignavibacteria bacterium]
MKRKIIFVIVLLFTFTVGCGKQETQNENIANNENVNRFVKVGDTRFKISIIYSYESIDSLKAIRVYTSLGDGEYFIKFNSDEEYKSSLRLLDEKLSK